MNHSYNENLKTYIYITVLMQVSLNSLKMFCLVFILGCEVFHCSVPNYVYVSRFVFFISSALSHPMNEVSLSRNKVFLKNQLIHPQS
jgi:hypothetical protein